MFGEEEDLGGLGEFVLFGGFTPGLEAQELGGFAFATAREAVFLKLEIAQLFFVLAADFEEEVGLPSGLVPEVGIVFGYGGGATGDDGEFEDGRGRETPTSVDDGLHERALFRTDWLIEVLIFGSVAGVAVSVFGIGEEDGGAGEAVFDGVEFGLGFAFVRARTGGFLSVFSIGSETSFRQSGWG